MAFDWADRGVKAFRTSGHEPEASQRMQWGMQWAGGLEERGQRNAIIVIATPMTTDTITAQKDTIPVRRYWSAGVALPPKDAAARKHRGEVLRITISYPIYGAPSTQRASIGLPNSYESQPVFNH